MEELKKEIINQPDKSEVWLVYADYLQEQGIVEGELITLHFAYQEADAKRGLMITKRINEIIGEHWDGLNDSYWPSFRDKLSHGGFGAEMMVMPAGKFIMGSSEDEKGRGDGETQHEVIIEKSFALGKYAVTFAEYDTYCKATGRTLPNDEGWGRGDRPVINVSWFDARDYCLWLSEQTGATYRLPSEAEWEYACRAGSSTAFWWGNSITTKQANYDEEFREKTLPVQSFKPNPWGLYQMHGNVYEWCGSVYTSAYDGSESLITNDSDSQLKDKYLVSRGGSWISVQWGLRSAFRDWARTSNPCDFRGFRLAKNFFK